MAMMVRLMITMVMVIMNRRDDGESPGEVERCEGGCDQPRVTMETLFCRAGLRTPLPAFTAYIFRRSDWFAIRGLCAYLID